jgi:hypothetical protein
MKRSDPYPAAQPADLHSAVHHQSWSWLAEIGRRLDFTPDIVDERGASVTLPGAGAAAVPARRSLTAGSDLHSLIDQVLRTNEKQRATGEGWDLVCCPLSVSRVAVGALVLARHASRTAAVPPGGDLDEVAPWLLRAVQAQLDLPIDEGEAFDRVSSLHRLLHDAVDHGLEQDVVTAFAEALIAWDGLEVRGYVQDAHGQFTLAVATPGADRAQSGLIPADATVPHDATLYRLTAAEADRLAFRRDRDHFFARTGSAYSQPWLIALSGAVRSDDESRLSLYMDLLRDAVDRVATIAETRLSWVMLQQLLGGTGEIEDAGDAALAELKRAIAAESAMVEVTGSRGVRAVAFGDTAAFAAAHARELSDELRSSSVVHEGQTMTLVLRRPRAQAFTRRERQIAERAGAILSAWLSGVLKRASSQERRAENREFQQVLDRVAGQSIRDGLDVAVVVLLAPGVISRPGLLQRWTTEIRGRLRGSDLAGMLSDREVGILLSGINSSDTATVSRRICQQAIRERGGVETGIAIGIASRTAGATVNGSLVKEARQDAERQTGLEPTGSR